MVVLENHTYFVAYNFFERLAKVMKKPKSKARTKIEKLKKKYKYAKKYRALDGNPQNRMFWCHPSKAREMQQFVWEQEQHKWGKQNHAPQRPK